MSLLREKKDMMKALIISVVTDLARELVCDLILNYISEKLKK